MKQLLCFLAFLMVANGSLAGEFSVIPDRELALAGISLGNTEAFVATKLGQPRIKTDTGEGIQLDYVGLTIWVGYPEQKGPGIERRVYELVSTSPKYCTPSGVCPGMPFAEAKAKYGLPLVAKRENGTFMEYLSAESYCWLQIAVNKGVIHSVRAECQP